nr:Cof-type HAD-IIB family hydrolase [Eggerthella lenta]
MDLDGTLTNSRKEVTPRVRDAVRRTALAGVHVILASGRPVVGMAHVADGLGLDEVGGYVLANNGSKIIEWRSKETVFEATLPRKAVEEACAAARAFGVAALAYDENGLFSEDPAAPYVERERFNNSASATKVDDLAAAVTWDPNKAMVVGEPDALRPALEHLSKRLSGIADVFLSEPYFIEVTPLGIRKDAALGVLADQLGFGLDELMACGDGLNDIPMLACAGLAVAMDNAYPETKAHADWIAPSNEEDGVAAAVDRFVFGGRACC